MSRYLCLTLCDPMDCSMPGFPVLRHLLEFAQTHVPWVSDATQPSHPFSSCLQSFPLSKDSFPMSQYFTSGDQSIGASVSASVLLKKVQDWFPLGLTGLISLLSKGLSRVFTRPIVQKHQFFGAWPSFWSSSHILTWLLERPSIQFSRSVVSDSLPPHGLQHTWLPCPSPIPRACSNSSPLSQSSNHLILYHPLLLPSIFPSIRVFSNESVLRSGSQSIVVSASTWVLPMNIQDWFPLGWTGGSPCCPRDYQESSPTTIQKHQFFSAQLSLQSNSHIHTWLLEKQKLWLDGPLLVK